MAEVKLLLNSRTYVVGCDDGQEARVQQLGSYIDERLRDIARAAPGVGEAHLLVLTALMLTDELFEVREAAQGLQSQLRNEERTRARLEESLDAALESAHTGEPTGADPRETEEIIAQVQALAQRVGKLVERLQAA